MKKYQWIKIIIPNVESICLFGFEVFSLEKKYSKRFKKFVMQKPVTVFFQKEEIEK